MLSSASSCSAADSTSGGIGSTLTISVARPYNGAASSSTRPCIMRCDDPHASRRSGRSPGLSTIFWMMLGSAGETCTR